MKETKTKSRYYYSVTRTSAATKCSHVRRFTVLFMSLLTNKPTSETTKLKVCGIYALYSEFSVPPFLLFFFFDYNTVLTSVFCPGWTRQILNDEQVGR